MKDYKQIIIMEPNDAQFRNDPADVLPEGWGRVKTEDIPLGPDEVMGETLYSLLSIGTEMNFYLGNYIGSPVNPKYPRYCGYACCFRVEKVGSEVTDLKEGDLVYARGPHATIQRLHRRDIVKMPEGMDPRRAPFTKFMCVGMSTLTDSLAKPPAKVLVTGLGNIGVMSAQCFQRCGYDVVCIGRSQSKIDLAHQCGIEKIFTEMPYDDPDYGGQISIALECTSNEGMALAAAKMLRRFGEEFLVATHLVGTGNYQMHDLLNVIYRNNITVRGGAEWRIPLYEPSFKNPTAQKENDVPAAYLTPYWYQNSYEMNMKAALKWLNEGSVIVDPLYDIVDPRDAATVYRDAADRKNLKPALLFDWTNIK